ncbi:phytoene desaturase family protein [Maribellus mangrovi]|uniref:phytoene desaturase family protein n=1 Tax=Maribellus mangrovi TaxID=3133146 RepID=UPI0030EBC950
MNKKVLVVGAGLGGLATALRLVKRGYSVEMIEKNEQAGGRLNQIKKDGFTFDTGPSFFSMSYEFEEFARDCNIELPFDYFELDPLYSVNFKDNPRTFHLFKDAQKLAEQFAEIEPDFQEKFEKYQKKAGALFNDTVDLVIKQNFNSMLHYIFTLMRVNPVHIPVLFKSFYQHVNKYFSSKEAVQIISLVAFFLGRTPFDTMAIYSLLSYTEFKHDGYYNVKGGMYKIVEGLVKELEKENIRIHYNTEITGFEEKNGKLLSLIDQNGKKWQSDSYLINSDAAWFRGNIFKRKAYSEKKLDKMSWTMGYLTFYVGIKRKLPMVDHHNYYLGGNYEAYANNIMQNPDTLEKPYYYVNVLSKNNADCAPEGCESLFFVCPVPNLYHKPDWSDKQEIVNSIIDDFSERIGVNIQKEIVTQTIYTPIEWRDRFNLHRGSGLGLSHNMNQIGHMRPRNVDEKYNNVFYVGASTAPGAGLPMAIISSKLAFERIDKHFR